MSIVLQLASYKPSQDLYKKWRAAGERGLQIDGKETLKGLKTGKNIYI